MELKEIVLYRVSLFFNEQGFKAKGGESRENASITLMEIYLDERGRRLK